MARTSWILLDCANLDNGNGNVGFKGISTERALLRLFHYVIHNLRGVYPHEIVRYLPRVATKEDEDGRSRGRGWRAFVLVAADFRKMRKHFNVVTVWCGGIFERGNRMPCM